jgi:hypothetical protein
VHQALDAASISTNAPIGDVGDLAEEARALRIARDDPRVFAELLEAQRHRFFSASNLRILAVTSSPTDSTSVDASRGAMRGR